MQGGFAGKVAVVTGGAGSGIGQALAMELGRSGAKLAISDIDTEGLAVTEERLKRSASTSRRTGLTSPSARPSRPTPTASRRTSAR